MENNFMEGNNQVCNGGTNSGKGMFGKLLVGALGVAAGVVGAVIYKKKKNQNKDEEITEIEVVEDESNDEE